MNLLEIRERNGNDVYKKQFIQKVLSEQGNEMIQAQNKAMNERGLLKGLTSDLFKNTSFSVTNDTLEINILKLHRFVDMSTRDSATGKHKKKSHPIYNRIVFGHLPNIVNELSFGFSDAVIQELKELENNF